MLKSNGLFKTELINRQGPWRGVDHVEFETLLYIDWFNNQRLHGELGHITPVEVEDAYYAQARFTQCDAKTETLSLR